jgi:hypothetical protein
MLRNDSIEVSIVKPHGSASADIGINEPVMIAKNQRCNCANARVKGTFDVGQSRT